MVRVHVTQLPLAASALSQCTQMVLPPPCQSNIVRPADASGMRRDLVMPFRTLSAKDVCQESENQSVDLPDLKKNTPLCFIGSMGSVGGVEVSPSQT